MRTIIAALAAILSLVAGVMWLGPGSSASVALAEGQPLPGMCNGQSDPNVALNAHANGSRQAGVPKYILNLSTDELGDPTGTLIVGQGKDRLLVEEWCRLWLHQPDSQPPSGGQCEEDEGHEPGEGAINAHAVGLGWHHGERVLVRTDVRETDEGMFFRVRFRAMGEHDEHEFSAAVEDEGCDDESWHRIPIEGWAPLAQLKVH